MNRQPKFHVTALHDYEMFRECIAFCMHGLRQLGYIVTYEDERLDSEAINIVFAAHCKQKTWSEISKEASRVIFYNWEPASPAIARFTQSYLRMLQHAHVWDYSARNIQELKTVAGILDIHHVPMGYAPEMTRIKPAVEQDIDVLFYGDIYWRRKQVIDQLRAKGLNVVTNAEVGRIDGERRDELIARSKVLLNIHAFEQPHIFEIARVSYWLANSKAIVTEVSDQTEIDIDIKSALASGKIDELADICFDLVYNEAKRHALEQKGFAVFSKKKAADIMQPAIERYLQQSQATPPAIGNPPNSIIHMPTTLQIGAGLTSLIPGEQWNYSHCNIDARADYAPDLVIDIEQTLPLNQPLHSWRFGAVELKAGYFEKICAYYLFHKTKDLRTALTNCLDLLCDGGVLELTVPLDFAYSARTDIEVCRAFNEHSWSKILENWWEYGWSEHRFELISSAPGLISEYDDAGGHFGHDWLAANNNDWEVGIRVPRVLDFLQVVLRKRALTEDEKKLLPHVRFMD